MPTPTVFLNLENNALSALGADHVIGDGVLHLQSGDGTKFGSTWPARATAVHPTTGAVVIYQISGRTADALAIDSAIEGTADIGLPAGSVVGMDWTKGAKTDIEGAIHALEGMASGGVLAADQMTVGIGCAVVGVETGGVAMGFGSEVVDGTGEGGVDFALAQGDHNRSQSVCSAVFGSYGLGYSRNQFVVGGGTYEYFANGTGTTGAGVCQAVVQPLIGLSTDGSPATLTTGNTGGPGNTVAAPIVRAGHALAFDVTIVGRKGDGSAFARFKRSGLIANTGGTTALVGSVQTIGADINTPGWSVSVTADDAGDAIEVQATGEATVHWAARLECMEVA
jgi:hypothetical protein